jgi:hypothetical protein
MFIYVLCQYSGSLIVTSWNYGTAVCEGVRWIKLAQDGVMLWARVNTIMKVRIP